MPPTEISADGMLCLSRHENCPWDEALKTTEPTWTGLRYTCLKILHLYCKVFEREDVLDTIIRKTCKSCGCDRLKHSVYHEELSSVRDRLGLRDELRDGLRDDHSLDALPGLNAKETELFWQSLSERTGAGGAGGAGAWRAWRARALASQLPRQDLSLAHCRHVDDVHRKQYEDFVAARNEIALDIGIGRQVFGKSLECIGCNKPIRSGNIAVEAPRLGEQAFFHPGCFSCSECEEPLVEFAYCALDGRLYCVRHYAERLKPRCHACDESGVASTAVVSGKRSLDGIKYRPLQRQDPSGSRRSFRRRRSSSHESRASLDEELQMFTSLEEAELTGLANPPRDGFGSAPNLRPHSFRSRSRELHQDSSKEGSVDSVADDAKPNETGPAAEQAKDTEVIEEEDDVDFWGNSSD